MVEAELLRTKEAVKQSILKIPGVSGIGAAASIERVIVYIKQAIPEILQKIPDTIGGFPVEIINTQGPIVALQLLALQQRTDRFRPAPGGVSVGHHLISAGSLGSRVFDAAGNRFVLSNNHVLANSSSIQNIRARVGDIATQPGPFDGGTVPNDNFSTLHKFIPLNEVGANIVDCSIDRPLNDEDLSDEILDVGVVTSQATVQQGETVKKSGRTTKLTTGKVLDTNATIRVDYGPFEATFDDQIITGVMADGGDSISYDSTMYWKENGNLRFGSIEELYDSNKNGKSIEVLSVKRSVPYSNCKFPSMQTVKIGWSRITDAIYHGIKPVYEITLHNGKKIKATKDHSLFSVEGFTSCLVPMPIEKINNVASVDNYSFETQEIDMDDNILTFLGLWLADGCYMKKTRVIGGLMISTGGDKEIISFVEKLITRFKTNHKSYKIAMEFSNGSSLNYRKMADKYDYDIGSTHRIMRRVKNGEFNFKKGTKVISHKSKGDYRIHSIKLAKLVSNLFGDVNSHTKRVPKEIFLASRRQIGLFLRGYYSGDGSAHTGQHTIVECASVNRKLLEDIQVLLDRLGIKGIIDTGYIPTKLSKSRQYKLRTERKRDIKKFFEYVGFIKKIKEKFFEDLEKKNEEIERPMSSRGIRKIEPVGVEKVYDLKVNPTESFVANGILCHNSGSIILNESNQAVGLLFAGSPSITAHNKIQNVLSALQVTFGEEPPPPPPPPTLATLAGGLTFAFLAATALFTFFGERISGKR